MTNAADDLVEQMRNTKVIAELLEEQNALLRKQNELLERQSGEARYQSTQIERAARADRWDAAHPVARLFCINPNRR